MILFTDLLAVKLYHLALSNLTSERTVSQIAKWFEPSRSISVNWIRIPKADPNESLAYAKCILSQRVFYNFSRN